MPRDTPWQDEYTLLCERCGYIIEGLDEAGACPECGRPIAQSLPQRRVGTPWQQQRIAGSLLRTWWLTLRHPGKVAKQIRVEHGESIRLPLILIFTASLSVLPATICFTIAVTINSPLPSNHLVGIVIYTLMGGAYGILAGTYAATAIPRLCMAGRVFGHRITRPAAVGAVSYACVGIILAPILVSAFFVFASAFIVLDIESRAIGFILTSMFWSAVPVSLIAFELLLLIAYRNLRYRTASRSELQEPRS